VPPSPFAPGPPSDAERPRMPPKRPQDGPKRRQERPKSRPRAGQETNKNDEKRSPSSVGLSGWPPEASGSHFGSILEPPGDHFGAIFQGFSKQAGPESPARNWRQTRETLPALRRRPRSGRAPPPGEKPIANARNAPSSKRPAQAAQRPRKGIKRSSLLAILMLALLPPRLLYCSSWPCALVCLAVLASPFVLSVACNACGSRVERASRSTIARFIFGAKNAECIERGAFFRKIRSPSWCSVPFSFPGGLRERF